MNFLCMYTLFLAILSYCSRAQGLSLRKKYFIRTPENTSIEQSVHGYVKFGTFQCATRSGYAPLWIINTQSVEDIHGSSGYGRTNFWHIRLQGQGNFLSFLSIPASKLTNNSIVECAVIVNGQPVVYSDPAFMVVLQAKPGNSTSTSDFHMSSSTTSSTKPEIVTSPHQKTVLSVEWISGLIVTACLICGLVTLIVFAGAIIFIQRRHQYQGMEEFRCVIRENNYWRRDNQVFPTTDESSADFMDQKTDESSADFKEQKTDESSANFMDQKTDESSTDFNEQKTDEGSADFKEQKTDESSADFKEQTSLPQKQTC